MATAVGSYATTALLKARAGLALAPAFAGAAEAAPPSARVLDKVLAEEPCSLAFLSPTAGAAYQYKLIEAEDQPGLAPGRAEETRT